MLPRRRLTATCAAVLLLGAAACGRDGERIDAEDAGVGPEAGVDVLVDTAATPPGGIPGMTPGAGADTAAGAPQ